MRLRGPSIRAELPESHSRQLEDQERLASFPDNPSRVADMERIRAEKQEAFSMMDEEYKLPEQYKEVADG